MAGNFAASTLAGAGKQVDKDGKELVNPHIPQFMAKAPWYLSQGGAGGDGGLSHQRRGQVEDQSLTALAGLYASRGAKQAAAAGAGFRKGACRNCGAATHAERDCLERPRAVGAWKTGAAIAPDEALPADVRLGWDAKRDRYAGYDVEQHARVVAKYEAVERERAAKEAADAAAAAAAAAEAAAAKAAAKAARAERRAARRAAAAAAGGGGGGGGGGEGGGEGGGGGGGGGAGADAGAPADDGASSGAADDDDDADSVFSAEGDPAAAAAAAAAGEGGGGKARMVAWNVRTRQDTAKYLLNLDTESAFYDPKTRSMRENPFAPGDARAAELGYAGDNALRAEGAGPGALAGDQLFAWEAYNRGVDVHLQGNPTQVALLKTEFAARKDAVRRLVERKLADRYGGGGGGGGDDADAGGAPVAATEAYTEYVAAVAPDGRVVSVPVPAGARAGGGGGGGGGDGAAGAGAGAGAGAAAGAGAGAAGGGGARRPKYAEDVHPGNHSSVFGSWFDRAAKAWGYACCHDTNANAYCAGAAGRAARADAAGFAARAAAAHAAGTAERAAAEARRAAEAGAAGRVAAAEDDERARKRPRVGDPAAEGGGGGAGD